MASSWQYTATASQTFCGKTEVRLTVLPTVTFKKYNNISALCNSNRELFCLMLRNKNHDQTCVRHQKEHTKKICIKVTITGFTTVSFGALKITATKSRIVLPAAKAQRLRRD
jgi:hypothetical protein